MPCRNWGWLLSLASVVAVVLAPVGPSAYADPDPATTHVVQPGETLSQIADSIGTDSATLAALNGLDDANALAVGQSLKLAGAGAGAGAGKAAAASPAPPTTYTVADGDTLWSIAQQLGTTSAALVQANNLSDPDHLGLGTQLVVPAGAGPAQPKPAAQPAPAAAASSRTQRTLLVNYTVQAGETLTQIAQQTSVSADAIIQASGLADPNKLSIGTVLKVPLPGHEHVVQAGETLRDIAQQEKVDLGSLIDFNQIDDPELIHVDQVVLVPPVAPTLQAAAAPTLPPATPPAPAAPSAPAAAPPAPAASSPAPAAPSAPAAAPPAPAAAPPAPATASSGAPASSAPPAAPAAAVASAAAKGPAAPAPAAKASAPGSALVTRPAGAPTDSLAGVGLNLLGSPYVWGGSSPSGFDCSGFVWYVARQAGKSLNRGMFGEYNSGSHPSRDDLKPGDLVFFQNTYAPGLSHNGIYIGNNQFVHAADEAAGVTISSLTTSYWSSHWFGATRLA